MKKLIFFLMAIILVFVWFWPPKKFLVVSSLPLYGIMGDVGKSIKEGADIAKKELFYKKVKYLFLDDRYEPSLTLENIKNTYEKRHPFLLYGIVGTPTVKKILPFVNEHSLYLYAPFSGAEFLRKQKNIINFRVSYKDEIKHIVNYLLKRKIEKISVFYQDDAYGYEIYSHTYEVLKKHNLKISSIGDYKRNTYFIDYAIKQILKTKPQAIIIGGTANVSAMFIKKVKKIDSNIVFCLISFVDAEKLIKQLTDYKNIIFSEVVPFYKDIKIGKNYLHKAKNPSFFGFEAYITNYILLKAFKKLSFPYTPSHLIEIIKHSSIKGLDLKYYNNQLMHKSYLYIYENNTFKEIK